MHEGFPYSPDANRRHKFRDSKCAGNAFIHGGTLSLERMKVYYHSIRNPTKFKCTEARRKDFIRKPAAKCRPDRFSAALRKRFLLSDLLYPAAKRLQRHFTGRSRPGIVIDIHPDALRVIPADCHLHPVVRGDRLDLMFRQNRSHQI